MVTENEFSDSSTDSEESEVSSVTSSSNVKVKNPRGKKKTYNYPSTAESSENVSKTTESTLPTKSESSTDAEKGAGKGKKHKEFKKARKYIRKVLGTPDVAKKQTVSSINRQVMPRGAVPERTVKGRGTRSVADQKVGAAPGEAAKGRRFSVTQPVQSVKVVPQRLQGKVVAPKTLVQRGETSLNTNAKKLTANSVTGSVKTVATKKKTNTESYRKKVAADDPAEKKSSGEPITEAVSQKEDVKPPTKEVPKKKGSDASETLKKKKQPLDSSAKTVKKEVVHPRKVAVRKTDGQPRSVQPSSTVKTDGRSDRGQRKHEMRGSQGRTAFTMSGLRQGAALKNLAKDRIVGQSDQA